MNEGGAKKQNHKKYVILMLRSTDILPSLYGSAMGGYEYWIEVLIIDIE